MKPTVYIETTIVSYLTALPSRDLIRAGHQQLTVEWWQQVRPQVECVVSPFVLAEAERGDADAAARRMKAIEPMRILVPNSEIRSLANEYYALLELPEKARTDAAHLAISVWYEINYLLTWNCTHIASGVTRRRITEFNGKQNLFTPIICTPEELMEV